MQTQLHIDILYGEVFIIASYTHDYNHRQLNGKYKYFALSQGLLGEACLHTVNLITLNNNKKHKEIINNNRY